MRRGDGLLAGVIGVAGCALAAAPVACFLLLQPAARADPPSVHYGMGVAPGGLLGGDLARKLDTGGHVGGRFFLGLRRPGIGVEASLAGTDASVIGEDAVVSTFALAIEARPSLELARGLTIYLHGGPSYDWIGATEHPLGQFSGLGVVYGAGFELSTQRRLESGWLLGISFWAEESVQHLDLAGDAGGELRGTVGLTLLGLGFSFGR
jgi:hypothetical protein